MLWANDALGRAFGPESGAVVNRPFVELLDPYDRRHAVRGLTRLDAVGDEVAFEARLHPVAGGFPATWSWRVGRDGLLYILGTEAEPDPLPPPERHRPDRSPRASSPRPPHRAPPAAEPSTPRSARQLERCRRDGLPLSVAIVDLDRFKHYNDTYGHLAGDQCLVTVARALQRRASREGELVGRFGGDEFLILWPGIDLTTAIRNADAAAGDGASARPAPGQRARAGQRERRRHHRGAHRLDLRARRSCTPPTAPCTRSRRGAATTPSGSPTVEPVDTEQAASAP